MYRTDNGNPSMIILGKMQNSGSLIKNTGTFYAGILLSKTDWTREFQQGVAKWYDVRYDDMMT